MPEMAKTFSIGSGIFQQDFAPYHTSQMVTTFFLQKGIHALESSGNSADLNRIESLWLIIKESLKGKDSTLKQKFIEFNPWKLSVFG